MKHSKEALLELAHRWKNHNNTLKRTNLVVTLSEGESMELSDGVTFTYFKAKSASQISVSIKAPASIYAYRVKDDSK